MYCVTRLKCIKYHLREIQRESINSFKCNSFPKHYKIIQLISIVLFEGSHKLIHNSFEPLHTSLTTHDSRPTHSRTYIHIYLKSPFIFCDSWMKSQMKTFSHILLTEYHTIITNQSSIYMCIYIYHIYIYAYINMYMSTHTYEKCHILLNNSFLM